MSENQPVHLRAASFARVTARRLASILTGSQEPYWESSFSSSLSFSFAAASSVSSAVRSALMEESHQQSSIDQTMLTVSGRAARSASIFFRILSSWFCKFWRDSLTLFRRLFIWNKDRCSDMLVPKRKEAKLTSAPRWEGKLQKTNNSAIRDSRSKQK